MTGMNSTWVKPRSRHVVDEVLGEVAVGVAPAPRAEVHLVDAHRLLVVVALRCACQPLVVVPVVAGLRRPTTRCAGGSSVACGHRVGLLADLPVGATDERTCTSSRRRRRGRTAPRPRTRRAARIGWLRPSQPLKSPTTCTAWARGAHTANDVPHDVPERTGVLPHVGAEDGPELLVAALADEVQVDRAERRGEPVGVVHARARRRRRSSRRGGSPASRSGPRAARPRRRRPRG